jgi:hypothetical protein
MNQKEDCTLYGRRTSLPEALAQEPNLAFELVYYTLDSDTRDDDGRRGTYLLGVNHVTTNAGVVQFAKLLLLLVHIY